jgi:hypothetical protein
MLPKLKKLVALIKVHKVAVGEPSKGKFTVTVDGRQKVKVKDFLYVQAFLEGMICYENVEVTKVADSIAD